METLAVNSFNRPMTYNIPRFWGDEFKSLPYRKEPFNDPVAVAEWQDAGYDINRSTGLLCDMKGPLPEWTTKLIKYFEDKGWKDVGVAFYKMTTGTVMPVHSDRYKRYIEIFNLQDKQTTVRRALLLLEDWKPGHYLEVDGQALVHWKAGDVVEWVYDTPHMAANIGLETRYTLQITGHV